MKALCYGKGVSAISVELYKYSTTLIKLHIGSKEKCNHRKSELLRSWEIREMAEGARIASWPGALEIQSRFGWPCFIRFSVITGCNTGRLGCSIF